MDADGLSLPRYIDDSMTAARGWIEIAGVASEVTRITPLKESRKSRVYRLHLRNSSSQSIIAKRRLTPALLPERLAYTFISEIRSLPAVRLLGVLNDEVWTWHYLEDAGTKHFQVEAADHMAALAVWLARLHDAAYGSARPDSLPVDPSEHRLEDVSRRISSARLRRLDRDLDVALGLASDALQDVAATLHNLLGMARLVPSTLVHGDLQPKNILIRADRNQLCTLPIDWETAQWSSPGLDLASLIGPDLDTRYLDIYRETRSAASVRTDEALIVALIGRVFRGVAGIDWALFGLDRTDGSWPVEDLCIHARRIWGALSAIESRKRARG